MKTQVMRTLLFFLLLSICMISVGYAGDTSKDYIRMKRGSAPQIVAEDGKAKTIPAGFIQRRLRLGYPTLKFMIISDQNYIFITEKWFSEVIVWTEEFVAKMAPNVDFKKKHPAGYEETVALLAANLANGTVARRYNLNASVLMGFIVAKSEKPWGQIPADGEHRVYLIGLTEKSGIVHDLRTKQSIQADKFPNIDSMVGIIF